MLFDNDLFFSGVLRDKVDTDTVISFGPAFGIEGVGDFFQRVQLSREPAGSALGQKDVTGIHKTVGLAGEYDFSLADTLRRIGIKGMESHAVHQMSLRIADQFKVEVFSRLDDLFISLNSKILCAAQTDACGKEDG